MTESDRLELRARIKAMREAIPAEHDPDPYKARVFVARAIAVVEQAETMFPEDLM